MPQYTLKLTAPGLDDLALDESDGWYVRSFEPGSPTIRRVSVDRPGTHGSIDSTALTGARSCTLRVDLAPASRSAVGELEDRLRTFVEDPSLRPTIRWSRPGRPERIAVARGDAFDALITGPDIVPIIATWVIPSGRWESAVQHVATIIPGAPSGGLEIPQTGLAIPPAGLMIPSVGPPGYGIVYNAGAAPAAALLRAHGPFGDTSDDVTVIRHRATGSELVFRNLEVAQGEYLDIDLDTGRILLNSDPAQSRRNFLDQSQSQWFLLERRANEIEFTPGHWDTPAQLQVFWRDAW